MKNPRTATVSVQELKRNMKHVAGSIDALMVMSARLRTTSVLLGEVYVRLKQCAEQDRKPRKAKRP